MLSSFTETDINTKTIENLELMINEVDVICNEGTIEEKGELLLYILLFILFTLSFNKIYS